MDLAVRVVHDPDAAIRRIAVRRRPRDIVNRHFFEATFGEVLRSVPVQFVACSRLIHARKLSAQAVVRSTGPASLRLTAKADAAPAMVSRGDDDRTFKVLHEIARCGSVLLQLGAMSSRDPSSARSASKQDEADANAAIAMLKRYGVAVQ